MGPALALLASLSWRYGDQPHSKTGHGTTAAFWDEIHMVGTGKSRYKVKAKAQCALLVAEGLALIEKRNTAQKHFYGR